MDKPYFVGQRSLQIVQRKNAKAKLVGFTLDSTMEGATPKECHLVIREGKIAGRVTSIAWSPALEKYVGLAFVSPEIIASADGFFIRADGGQMVPARIAKTPFYDPAGDRQKVAA
jgi:sarcosine oxidase subunit alpha